MKFIKENFAWIITALCLIAMTLFSCTCFYPRSPQELQRRVQKHDRKPFIVQQWVKQRSDGYWLVTSVYSNKDQEVEAYECKPRKSKQRLTTGGWYSSKL